MMHLTNECTSQGNALCEVWNLPWVREEGVWECCVGFPHTEGL